MTANQIAYWNLQESKRSNLAKELEMNRSNVAKELETNRSNVAKEKETHRSNRQKEKIDTARTIITGVDTGLKYLIPAAKDIVKGVTTAQQLALFS